jgi:hypothetical protein
MNCQQFTSLIVEVARGQMMDAASRDGAMRHAESCQACAARLAQEQSLTGALRTVALGMKDLSAPASVEAKLLAAFRESLVPQNATATAATNTTPHAPVPLLARATGTKPFASRPARRAAYAVTAIAASLVLVVLAALYLRVTQTASPSLQDMAANDKQAVSKAASPDKALTVEDARGDGAASEPSNVIAQQRGREMPDINRGVKSGRATIKHARPQTPTIIEAQHVIDGGDAIIEASAGETIAANTAAKPNEAESVTDFISLVADAPAATPLESGQLVRVQVPRAALASLGLPLNAERGNEPVKADVLLGGDGLARAIRFVR